MCGAFGPILCDQNPSGPKSLLFPPPKSNHEWGKGKAFQTVVLLHFLVFLKKDYLLNLVMKKKAKAMGWGQNIPAGTGELRRMCGGGGGWGFSDGMAKGDGLAKGDVAKGMSGMGIKLLRRDSISRPHPSTGLSALVRHRFSHDVCLPQKDKNKIYLYTKIFGATEKPFKISSVPPPLEGSVFFVWASRKFCLAGARFG